MLWLASQRSLSGALSAERAWVCWPSAINVDCSTRRSGIAWALIGRCTRSGKASWARTDGAVEAGGGPSARQLMSSTHPWEWSIEPSIMPDTSKFSQLPHRPDGPAAAPPTAPVRRLGGAGARVNALSHNRQMSVRHLRPRARITVRTSFRSLQSGPKAESTELRVRCTAQLIPRTRIASR